MKNLGVVLVLSILAMGLIGQVMCFYKMLRCNWEPIGKAEVMYTVGSFTGSGSVIGWFDIEDK